MMSDEEQSLADYSNAVVRLRRVSLDLSRAPLPHGVADLVDEAKQCLTVILLNGGPQERTLTPVEELNR
jgi:hypothetical protein